jgi:FAD/FMN-containing dehydrogenase/Fe-S oxidoreductase
MSRQFADRLDAEQAEANRVAAELRAAGVTAVDASRLRRAEYSTDASNYRVVPRVVVFPRGEAEVAATLAVARDRGMGVTARGGGTSCAGNAIGTGIVMDFSRHMNRVVSIDAVRRRAIVQPGTVLADLQRLAAQHGLRFGPDPSTQSRCTIGGMIGNNACGSHTFAYGRTSDNVRRLGLILADGRRLEATGLDAFAFPETSQIRSLVMQHEAVIRREFGRFSRQVSGYALEHLLAEHGSSLAKLIVGSEGTLAIVVEAEVDLVEMPRYTALAVLGYDDMPTAADAVPQLLATPARSLEGMDRHLIDVLINRRGPTAAPALPDGDGWLLVETGGDTQDEALAAAHEIIGLADPVDSKVLCGDDQALMARAREDGAGLAGRTATNHPAWPGWEDAAVPPERLGGYLRDFEALTRQHGVGGVTYGHFGDGCIHVRLDLPIAEHPDRFTAFVQEAARLAASHGGSVSGEHGDGRARGALLGAMYSPAALTLFGAVKRIFDPQNILNPGVIVDPVAVGADLRLPMVRELPTPGGFSYAEDGGSLSEAVHRCVGVGKCRADSSFTGGVMCPSYLATHDETHSTRGRARVLQELANGRLIDAWDAPEVTEALELCLSCKGCRSDCPAGVDMATYKAEVLHQRYRKRIRPRSHYTLGWLPRWSRLAMHAPALANMPLRSQVLARTIRHVAGMDRARPVPQFAPASFRSWFADHPPSVGDPVLLWVDTFTDAFTPEVGRAAVAVLESAGYRVEIPAASACCGLTWLSTGQLDGARRQLRRSLRLIEPALEAGIPIVGLEPSCTAVFRSDAVELLPDDQRARSAQARVMTLAELVTERGWPIPRLDHVRAVVQPHCHHHAVMGFDTDLALLRTGGATIRKLGGCCGMAGNFGVEAGHYELSVAIAEHNLLPAVRDADPTTVILTDGFSCRTQLSQLADRHGVHLAEVLASALEARSAPVGPASVTQ